MCEIGKVSVTMSNLFPFPTANKRKDVCSQLLYVILSILLGDDDDGSIIEHASHTLFSLTWVSGPACAHLD